MFAAERGVSLDLVEVDILAGENRLEGYLAINPLGGTPALLLEDGQVITETIAVCEYLDETEPGFSLIGTTAESRAMTRMWTRRIDLGFADPLTLGFRAAEGRAMFAPRMLVPEATASDGLKAIAFAALDFIERQCASCMFVTGEHFTLADIILFCFIEFAVVIGMAPLEGRPWLAAWHGRVSTRPSAAA